MDDVIKEFLVESREGLDQLDLDLLELEQRPQDLEILANVFRTVHSIKGTCGFFGYEKLERLAHRGETLLGRLRDQELTLDNAMATALLSLSDAVRAILDCIETDGGEGETDYEALAATLDRLADQSAAEAEAVAHADPPPPPSADSETEAAPAQADAGATTEPPTNPDAVVVPPKPAEKAPAKPGSVADASVRVDVSLLDSLMNQVGELVLARNQILEYSATHHDPVLMATTQRLNLITSELQEGVMKTRMQPIGSIWNKFPRVVRDLSGMLAKKVHLEMEGEETELDRTIIEAIKDPLTHIVRNAVDHGIESPEDRLAAGKPEAGTLVLHAFHEGGQVNVEIRDDGAGINPEKVKQKAIASQIITPDQAARMSDRDAMMLIFSAGFSTAAAVTNISGRGVGMDVVKTNIEKIGGSIDVQSRLGEGTVLRIKIPLTLAIIPALIVACDGDSYAIPQVSLVELVRIDGEQSAEAIERIHDVPVHRLRGKLLPLIWLSEQLGVGAGGADGGELNIAVLQADDRQFGLVVDEIRDNQEIVVKPLGDQLKHVTCYAGATIMGDGQVALILDALGIAAQSGVASDSRDPNQDATLAGDGAESVEREQSLLLFRAGEGAPKAVVLSNVARLEEFDADVIEDVGGRSVVQYRGDIMPLVELTEALGGTPSPRGNAVQVIAHAEGDFSVGIVVDEILDIVAQRIDLKPSYGSSPLLGSAVVQGRVTEIVDLDQIIDQAGLRAAGV